MVDGLPLHVEASIGIALLPGARRRRRPAAAARRRRDVRRQGRGSGARDLRRRARPARHARASPCSAELRRAIDATASSCCTTSRSSTCRTGSSPASRRSCAGSIPTRGLIPPERFIPLAEQTGLIAAAHRWACSTRPSRRRRAGQRDGHATLHVAVNLSARNLLDPRLRRAGRRRCSTASELPPASCLISRSPRARSCADPARDASDARRGSTRLGVEHRRSTTSAPATRRSPTSRGCRSTSSRSTGRS